MRRLGRCSEEKGDGACVVRGRHAERGWEMSKWRCQRIMKSETRDSLVHWWRIRKTKIRNERFANAFIKDTPERIATDTSQKVGIRFGNTIKSYIADENLDTKDLVGIPLALASWLRYLLAVKDNGEIFTPSSDPLLDELKGILKDVKLGDSGVKLDKILSKEDIFGLDLTQIELGERVEVYFNEMIASTGAVRATLKKYL